MNHYQVIAVRLILLILSLFFIAQGFALELSGPLQQGSMAIGRVAPGSLVLLDGQPVKVSEQGVFVIGFDRDAAASVQLDVVTAAGEKQQQTLLVAPREYAIQRIEGVAKKIMSPNKEDLKRIRSEALAVRTARARILDRVDFASPFQWPLTGPITGVFGSQRVYNGVPKRPHYGVDVAAAIGTPVSTPARGRVTLAHPDMFYSGGTLIIDHGHGVSSTLMHLSKVLVNVGDEVAPGDIVAEVGAGGRATGPHLDWRMNWLKARIDPQLLVEPMAE